MDVALNFPFGGVSEELAVSKQAPGTTRSAKNVHGVDPLSGRMTGAARRGLAKYCGQPVADGAPLQALDVCVFDSKAMDFSAMAQPTIKWSSPAVTGEAAANPVLDSQKNLYCVEGLSTIVKRNSDGVVVWSHQVGMPSTLARIAALAIDQDTDEIFTAAGTNVNQDQVFIPSFKPQGFIVKLLQKKDNKIEQAWKYPIEGYVSNLRVVKGELYATIERPERGSSTLLRLSNLTGDAPVEDMSRRIPYPCSGMAVRNSGVVYTTHPKNLTRGVDPRAKNSTAKTLPENMWTPDELRAVVSQSDPTQKPKNLLWAWLNADDLAAENAGGDLVLNVLDRSDSGRNLSQALHPIPDPPTKTPDAPRYVEESLGAEPGIRFVCEDQPTTGADPAFSAGLSSAPNMSHHVASAAQQGTLIPSYQGATSVVCFLARASNTKTISPLFFQRAESLDNYSYPPNGSVIGGQTHDNEGRGVYVNARCEWKEEGTTGRYYPVFLNTPGKVCYVDTPPYINGAVIFPPDPSNGVSLGLPTVDLDATDGVLLVTMISRGQPTAAGAGESEVWINGTLVARFDDRPWFGLSPTHVGWSPWFYRNGNGVPQEMHGFAGDILEIVSVDTGLLTDDGNVGASGLARAKQIAQLIEGYMLHRVGYSHKLPATHPYSPLNTNFSGPPNRNLLNGQPQSAIAGQLNQTGQMVCKWGGARFDIRAIFSPTTTPNSEPGGVGYGVEVEPDISEDERSAHLYTVGQSIFLSGGVVFASVALRRLKDTGSTLSDQSSDGAWYQSLSREVSATPPAAYPNFNSAGYSNRARLAVDGWGNAFVGLRPDPLLGIPLGYQLVCYSAGGALLATVAFPDMVEPDGINGVACATARDDFGPTDPVTRTESIWCVGERSTPAAADSVRNVAFQVTLVSSTPNGLPSREVMAVGVAGGKIRIVESDGVITPSFDTGVADPTLDAGARFVSTAVAFGKVYFTDGTTYCYLDCKRRRVYAWTATTGGKIPDRQQLLAMWRGRMMMAAGAEDRHNWHAAAFGDPHDWDQRPYLPTPTQAISGNNARAGKPSDIVTALVPWNDDTALFGQDHSISQLSGDPMAGGTIDRSSSKLDTISPTVGMAFGNSWTRDRKDILYFHDNVGAVHVMVPGVKPKNITDGKVESRMRAVDLSVFRPLLAYDDDAKFVHVFYVPYDTTNASASTEHFIFEIESKAWWPITFGSVGLQPTCAVEIDGDDPDDRALLIGCVDGYVRTFRADARDDDGVAIESRVLLGPIAPEESQYEYSFKCFEVELSDVQGGARFAIYGTDRADRLGDPQYTGALRPGRNPPNRQQVRGAYVAVEVFSVVAGSRWAFGGTAHLQAVMRGTKRVRR